MLDKGCVALEPQDGRVLLLLHGITEITPNRGWWEVGCALDLPDGLWMLDFGFRFTKGTDLPLELGRVPERSGVLSALPELTGILRQNQCPGFLGSFNVLFQLQTLMKVSFLHTQRKG